MKSGNPGQVGNLPGYIGRLQTCPTLGSRSEFSKTLIPDENAMILMVNRATNMQAQHFLQT